MTSDPTDRGERLQKVLAAAGLGSRRKCEAFIVEGRVEVNRQTVTELGTRVVVGRDEIRVDGEILRSPKLEYYLLNKPVGVVCTSYDPQHRTRVIDLVPSKERLFSVGRLDRSSEGLILLTNDGDFANRLAHPRFGVEKTYRAIVAGLPTQEELQKLRDGVYLSDGVARVESVRVRKRMKQSAELEIILREGKNREIRRIMARVGHKVMQLKRVAIGPLKMAADLPTGAYRPLTRSEISALLGSPHGPAKKKRRGKKSAASGGGTATSSPAKSARKSARGPAASQAGRKTAKKAAKKAARSTGQKRPASERPTKGQQPVKKKRPGEQEGLPGSRRKGRILDLTDDRDT